MRILSRFLAKLSRSNEVLPGVLCGGLAASIVLASSVAAAQPAPAPAPPAPAKPTAPAKPAAKPPAPKAPAKAPDAPRADQTGDAAAGAQGGGTAPAQPAPAPRADEPLMPPDPPAAGATGTGAAGTITVAPAQPTPAPAPAVAEPVKKEDKPLVKIGGERPTGLGDVGARPSDVYAEDWWTQARPVFEIHGYYRVRSELFHHFALGRKELVTSLWPQPADNDFRAPDGTQRSAGGPQGLTQGICGDNPVPGQGTPCQNNTQAGANMRFRINPELHISDNLRVMAQLDLLDNVVLGSTPEGYYNVPNKEGGYQVGLRGGYTPLGSFASTQWAPVAGVTSSTNSINVKRAWGEYVTPVGLLRFGRMPSHWGLGMLANSGDGYDSDWQSTSDRIMLVTGIKKWDLYFAGAWDFSNEGATSARLGQQQGQPYDVNQLDDVNQFVLVAARRRNPELQRLELAKGEAVVNGGVYFAFRNQVLANDQSGAGDTPTIGGEGSTAMNSDAVRNGLTRRNARAYIPDLWLQFLYRKFRFEAEAALVYGSMDSLAPVGNNFDAKLGDWKVRQFGLVTQSEYRAMEDKLRIGFGFGYATGDADLDSLAPPDAGLQPQLTKDRNFSEFRFHPDYRVDLILFRNILSRVQGAYYFRPSVEYDFTRDRNGQRLGGGGALIWSRASEFIQTPGHARDLGVELDFQIYYQSKDGSLNDDPDRMGGFFTSIQYGVMFPLSGFNYLPGELTRAGAIQGLTSDKLGLETETAQTLRWYLGILF